jgi:hypothetical protein
VDHRGSGPPWTGLHCRSEELIEAQPTGALVHDGSPRLHGNDEELTRVRSRASPETEEQRGDRETAVKTRRWRRSVRAMLKRGEKRREAWRGAVKPGGAACLLYGPGAARGAIAGE